MTVKPVPIWFKVSLPVGVVVAAIGNQVAVHVEVRYDELRGACLK